MHSSGFSRSVSVPNVVAPFLPQWLDIIAMSALIGYIAVVDALIVLVMIGRLLLPGDDAEGLSENEVAAIQAEQRGTMPP